MAVTTFAAIDIGSYEVSMKIFEMSKRIGFREINDVRYQLELGRGTYAAGRLEMETVDELCGILDDFKRMMAEFGVESWRACATSSLRELENPVIILEQIFQRTGIRVEILSNAEQHFLGYKSIAAIESGFKKAIQKGTAILDIGGGNLQISLFDKDALVLTQSIRMGSLRIRERLKELEKTTPHYDRLVEEFIRNDLMCFQRLYLKDKEISNLILMGDFLTDTIFQDRSGENIITKDEFLKKYGADRFRLLLESCENQAEYRLRSLQMRFDLSQDEQKVEFAKQAAALIAGFGTAVEREVYGTRAAEAAGLSPDVLRMEIDRARKRLLRQEKREETRREMDPAAAVQPFQRELRYDNVRSAVAEEGLLRMLFREPALLAQTEGLTAEDFSVPLFGRVYAALRERWQNDLAITPAALADSLSPAEMAHLTAVLQKQEPPLSETALADYLRILREERAKARVSDASDLLAMQRDLKKKKGYGGS